MPRELERLLLHPLVLSALGLWALNDHVLKAAWGNAFTGKLSDVTSLIVAPILLAIATSLLGVGRTRPHLTLITWCILMAFVMFSIKLFEPAADAYRYGLAALQWPFRCVLAGEPCALVPVSLAVDATDLWTLPAASVPVWLDRAFLSPPRAQHAGPHQDRDREKRTRWCFARLSPEQQHE